MSIVLMQVPSLLTLFGSVFHVNTAVSSLEVIFSSQASSSEASEPPLTSQHLSADSDTSLLPGREPREVVSPSFS